MSRKPPKPGSSKSSVVQIPPVPKTLEHVISRSTDPWIKSLHAGIKNLNDFSAHLPHKYVWRFKNVEAFNAEVAEALTTATDMLPVNQIYWRDVLANCEAFSLLTTWRTVDAARSCSWALARGDLLGAVLLARSALENVVQYVDGVRQISATITGASNSAESKGVLDRAIDIKMNAVSSTELEEYLLKTIFGTRLPGTEDFYQSFNVVGIIKRVAKVPHQGRVAEIYDLLSEVAHPNFNGRAFHIQEGKPGRRPGEHLRTIGPGYGPSAGSMTEAILWALSWSCHTNITAFQLMSQTIKTTAARFEIKSTVRTAS